MTSMGSISSGDSYPDNTGDEAADKRPRARRALSFLSTLAIGLAGGGIAGYVAGNHETPDKDISGITLAQAQQDDILYQRALQSATNDENSINATITDPSKAVSVEELHGTVTYRIGAALRGTPPQFRTLRNPILLSWNMLRPSVPTDDDILNGAWLAFQANTPDGRVAIEPIPFSGQNMHFEPAKGQRIFDTPVLEAVQVQGGSYQGEYLAVAVPQPGRPVDYFNRPGLVSP